MQICFATNNKNKLREIKQKLGKAYEIVSLSNLKHTNDLAETHNTLEENSLEKAQYIYDTYHINCFADDTGLLVEALNNEPGVNSARYAGPDKNSRDNIDLLLKNLAGIKNRKAKFVTVITLILDGEIHQFKGEIHGNITHKAAGVQGFGYDPIFIPYGWQSTFAEVDLKQKNKISHRAIAVEKLIDFLKTRR